MTTTDDGSSPIGQTFPPVTIERGPDGRLSWRTPLGDTVEVWQAARLGTPMDWHWHVKAANGEIVGQGEGHPRRRSARIAAMRYHPPVYMGSSPEAFEQVVADLLGSDALTGDSEGTPDRYTVAAEDVDHLVRVVLRAAGRTGAAVPPVEDDGTELLARFQRELRTALTTGLHPGGSPVVRIRAFSDDSAGLGGVVQEWMGTPGDLAARVVDVLSDVEP